MNHYDWRRARRSFWTRSGRWASGTIRSSGRSRPLRSFARGGAKQSFGEENVIAHQVGLLAGGSSRSLQSGTTARANTVTARTGSTRSRLNRPSCTPRMLRTMPRAPRSTAYGIRRSCTFTLPTKTRSSSTWKRRWRASAAKRRLKWSPEAMLCHESQLQYAHRPTLASEEFRAMTAAGSVFVRSLVGADTGNDIMEHLS